MRRSIFFILFIFSLKSQASEILIPMDQSQTNHLKAYGITYWVLTKGVKADWLLNYRGGSFAFPYDQSFENECVVRDVSYEIVPDAQYAQIVAQIEDPSQNEDVVKLEKAPKVAVYSPKNQEPWDDAVTLVLTYAEIPYDVVYDDEVLEGKLSGYDWLHLHHEDFTGQWGKFYASYANADWYQRDVATDQTTARKWGFGKVSQLKLAVAEKIRDFVAGGGFLFAMCSGADTYDIALAAQNTDICPAQFDGDPAAPDCEQKLDYSQCFAFQNFQVDLNPFEYKFSDIDDRKYTTVPMDQDYFTLFSFSAKYDPVPTMLTQDQTSTIKGFMGQTTAFNEKYIKPTVIIMGENKAYDEARYIHGDYGNGTWTFYGGHDPEDYQHLVGDPPTDLSLHPSSPGYRLILNNVLFPAAKKKKLKT
jgi:hypothetical protein